MPLHLQGKIDHNRRAAAQSTRVAAKPASARLNTTKVEDGAYPVQFHTVNHAIAQFASVVWTDTTSPQTQRYALDVGHTRLLRLAEKM